MAANYLEQLVAEWYEYQGYFVRRNVLVGKRDAGGHEGELDIVAFNPVKSHLVHIEPSMDADSWKQREDRYKRKFDTGKKYIPKMFAGFKLPQEIEQIALLVFASKKNHSTLGGGKIMLITELLRDIFATLRNKALATEAVPEHLSILRSFQFVIEYHDLLFNEGNRHG